MEKNKLKASLWGSFVFPCSIPQGAGGKGQDPQMLDAKVTGIQEIG